MKFKHQIFHHISGDHGPHCRCEEFAEQRQQEQPGGGQPPPPGKALNWRELKKLRDDKAGPSKQTGDGGSVGGEDYGEKQLPEDEHKPDEDYENRGGESDGRTGTGMGCSTIVPDLHSVRKNSSDIVAGYIGASGHHLRDKAVEEWLQNPDTDAFAHAIVKLIDMECGNGIDISRRIDSAKLVTQILSKNVNLSRATREEMNRRRLLVLCDISGSCMQMCNGMAATAYKLLSIDPRFSLVFQSDDEPYKIITPNLDPYIEEMLGKIRRLVNDGDGGGMGDEPRSEKGWRQRQHTDEACKRKVDEIDAFREQWRELLAYLSIHTVVALGDTDAIATYRAVSEAGKDLLYFSNPYRDTDEILQYTREWENPPKVALGDIATPRDAVQAIAQHIYRANRR